MQNMHFFFLVSFLLKALLYLFGTLAWAVDPVSLCLEYVKVTLLLAGSSKWRCDVCQLPGPAGGGRHHPAWHYWCDLCCVPVQCDPGCYSEDTCWSPCKKPMSVPRQGDWCHSWTTRRAASWLSFSSDFNRSNSFFFNRVIFNTELMQAGISTFI